MSSGLPPLKLAIAIMAYGGQISSYHARMWLDLGAALVRHPNFELQQFSTWDVNPVDRARNLALATAMAANSDWLLMVDADTFVTPFMGSPLLRMIEDAIAGGFAVVVAPVVSRRPHDPSQHLMVYHLPPGRSPSETAKGLGLHPIDSAATAIMAINLHKVGDATFKFVEATETQHGLSEDHAFCRQIRAAGSKIACDTRIATGHLLRPGVAYSTEVLG